MGEFNFEKAMALARAAQQGDPLPPPERREQTKKPATQFDFKTVVDRARQARPPKGDEDRADFTH